MEKDDLTSHLTTLILRLPVGILFLVGGVGKFRGFEKFSDALHQQFDRTFLAGAVLLAFIHLLPFVEVVLGVTLVLGVFTRYALIGASATLIVLFFGKALVGDGVTCAQIMIYLFVTVFALRCCSTNLFSLDSFIQRPI